MAIIYSYPTAIPTLTDLLLGTDVDKSGKPTKNFTIQSVVELIQGSAAGLGATLTLSNDARIVNTDGTFGANQSAINFANITGTGNVSGFAGFSTVGGANINGTTGAGFTAFTSTVITGTLQTSAQPNITSLGTLTSLSVNTSVTGTAVVTTLVAPGDDLKIASTKAIVDYIATKPATETLAETLVAGNVTDGTSIVVSAGDNITFTDTSKALFGSGQDLEVNNDGIDSFVTDLSTGDLRLRSDDAVKIQASTGGNTLATFTKAAGVDLYFANAKIFETLVGGVKVTGAFEATTSGTFASLVNTGTYTAGNGVGGAGQILSSTGTGTSWVTEVPLYNWIIEADFDDGGGANTPYTVASGDAIDFRGVGNVQTEWDLGTKELRISLLNQITGGGANGQVTFWDGSNTIDGNAGMTYDAAAFDLTVANIIKADSFTTTAGTATWVTTVLDGFTSITSALFVGNAAASLTPPIPPFAVGSADNVEFQGNASTANQLSFGGTIGTSGDVTTVTAPTYTSGGSQLIATTIADTVVTGKVLTNLSTTTAQTITATDTILEALGYLQSTVTGLPAGLDYIGTWDASGGGGGSPDLTVASTHVPGQYYICSVDSPAGGTFPNGGAVGPSEWKVGDWCIRGDAQNDVWQKIDNTSIIDGTGTTDKIARWTGPQTLGTGLISDDGSTVTIGNTGAFLVEGDTTLGNAVTDTVTATGPVTLNKNLILEKGLALDSTSTVPYGIAGQALVSGGGVNIANTWADLTVGTVTSVSVAISGNSLAGAVTNATTTPVITLAWMGGASGATQYVNGNGNLATFPTLDNYQYWTLSDDTTTVNISSTDTAKILGGTYITSVVSAADKSATLTHDATTRTDTNTILTPAFGATIDAIYAIGTTTGHVSTTTYGVTIPADVFTAATAGPTAGVIGLVPAPQAATYPASTGVGYFLNSTGTWTIPDYSTYSWDLQTDSGAGAKVTVAEDDVVILTSGNSTLDVTNSGLSASINMPNTGTSGTYTSVTTDAQGRVTAGTNPGGSGGGIFSGSKAITTTSPAQKAFTLTRAATGTLIFDVWFTSETNLNSSVAKKYTVAHAYNTDPVYNKIIDTGKFPNPFPFGTDTGFTVSFVNATALSVECYIIATGSIYSTQDIGYTIQVGHDSTNALTFTAA